MTMPVMNGVEALQALKADEVLEHGGKARALMHGRFHVSYEDVRALAVPILRHRVLMNFHAESDRLSADDLLLKLLDWKTVPRV